MTKLEYNYADAIHTICLCFFNLMLMRHQMQHCGTSFFGIEFYKPSAHSCVKFICVQSSQCLSNMSNKCMHFLQAQGDVGSSCNQ